MEIEQAVKLIWLVIVKWKLDNLLLRFNMTMLDNLQWIINHCLGLGHETMVCAVCLTMFFLLQWCEIGSLKGNNSFINVVLDFLCCWEKNLVNCWSCTIICLVTSIRIRSMWILSRILPSALGALVLLTGGRSWRQQQPPCAVKVGFPRCLYNT